MAEQTQLKPGRPKLPEKSDKKIHSHSVCLTWGDRGKIEKKYGTLTDAIKTLID